MRRSYPSQLLALTMLLFCAAESPSKRTAPATHEEAGACPFECCSYREWETSEQVALSTTADESAPIARTLPKATKVQALTGKVITKTPGEFVVKKLRDGFGIDEHLYLYNYLGEGFYKSWHQGRWLEVNVGCCSDGSIPGCTTAIDDECWGIFEKVPQSVWWAKIETPDKKIWWTKDTDKFINQDSCG